MSKEVDELKRRVAALEKTAKEGLSEPNIPQGSDGERRIAALEKAAIALNDRIWDKHKSFITIIFSTLAIVVGFYGLIFRADVRDSINQMERRVDRETEGMKENASKLTAGIDKRFVELELKVTKATEEMKRDFERFAGDALKKPQIEVLLTGGPLDGKVFEIARNERVNLGTVFLKNVGEKKAEALSIRFFASSHVSVDQNWGTVPSLETNFPSAFYYDYSERLRSIAPDETWSLNDYFHITPHAPLATNIVCKLRVFYGNEATEAKFQIRIK